MSSDVRDQLAAYGRFHREGQRPIALSDVVGQRAVNGTEDLATLRERSTELTLIDTEPAPTQPERGHRWPIIAVAAATALAVAVLIGVAGIALTNDDDDQSPSATVVPNIVATRREAGAFEPSSPAVTYVVPDGWENTGVGVVKPDRTMGVTLINTDDLFFTSFCRTTRVAGPQVGPTVDDLVSAWANLPGVDATAASDATVGGFAAKQIELDLPASGWEDCSGMFYRCSFGAPEVDLSRPGRCADLLSNDSSNEAYTVLPNQHEKVWILDVYGSRLMVIAWSPPNASQQDRAALDEIVDSIEMTTVETSVTEVLPVSSPIDCEREPCPWSAELTAQALNPPIPSSGLPNVALAPDGTLVALDPNSGTLTWYEPELRVVPLAAELREAALLAIGPHDIAYIAIDGYYVAVAPSGAEITRAGWTSRQPYPTFATAAGLIREWTRWPSPNAAPDMPWVDLDGNPIIDTRPYPTATASDAGIEVRLGERDWLLASEPGTRPVPLDFLPRIDGGVVILFDTWDLGEDQPANVDQSAPAINLLELSPEGTIRRYFVDTTWPPIVLPDGSLIVEHDAELVRLTLPA